MSVSEAKIASLAFPSSKIEKLKGQTPDTVEKEKSRLKRATKEFESFFMYQMLKTMRKTVPTTPLNEGAPFSGDMSKDVFTDMFDMQLAEKMVTGDKASISELLYQSLVKLIEAQYDDGEVSELKPLQSDEKERFEPLPAETRPIEPRDEPQESIPISKPKDLLPLSTRNQAVKPDAILSRYGRYINEAAEMTQLDPALIISVIQAESNGDPEAVSAAGAKGLMQLIDSTAADYGVREVFDPEENIKAGSRFLKAQLDRFGSLRLALAAYNAGPETVKRYGGVPPFPETRRYVDKIIDSLSTVGGTVRTDGAKGRTLSDDN